jgi:hypothetical protein
VLREILNNAYLNDLNGKKIELRYKINLNCPVNFVEFLILANIVCFIVDGG